jgi:uncharacterized membrane protein
MPIYLSEVTICFVVHAANFTPPILCTSKKNSGDLERMSAMDQTIAANVTAIVIVLLVAAASWRYCWKTLAHRIAPRLATWLIFLVASALSLASYYAHEHAQASFVANIANHVDVIQLVAIVVSVLISAKHERERLRLGEFDLWCLASAALIAFLWVATGSSLATNLLLQVLMCVGYGPTLWHLFKEKRNTEPFDVWCASLGIAMLALLPPLLSRPRDWLAIIYVGRATLSVMVILGVMWYFHRREISLNMPR